MAYPMNMIEPAELDIFKDGSDEDVCKLVAARIRQLRHDNHHTQEALAALADVPLRTFKRFEADGQASFATFIRILRALDRAKYLQLVLPAPSVRVSSAYEEKIAQARTRWQHPDKE